MYTGIDIGGTNTGGVLTDKNGKVQNTIIFQPEKAA